MIVSKPITNKFFKKQFSSFYNKICLVCSNKAPIYTNLTLSTYLCSKCAGKQRAIYKIKSTIHDKWTEEELKRMYVGGNQLASEKGIMQQDQKQIEEYVKEIDTLIANFEGDIFEEETQQKTEDVNDLVEVEEYNIPKIGSVYNKDEVSSEETKEVVQETTYNKKITTHNENTNSTRETTKYKVKTNEFTFVQKSNKKLVLDGVEEERLGLAGVNAEKTQLNKEQKYSYKNLLQPKKRTEEKTNIKKVVKNVTESSKVFFGNIINKFKK
ncbi:hypothetical protein BDAP_002541 [Binucleata daphniae]